MSTVIINIIVIDNTIAGITITIIIFIIIIIIIITAYISLLILFGISTIIAGSNPDTIACSTINMQQKGEQLQLFR